MKIRIRSFKNFGTKAAAVAVILGIPIIASANINVGRNFEEISASAASRPTTSLPFRDRSGWPVSAQPATGQIDHNSSALPQEAFVPEYPTILASVLLLLPLGGSALRILYKNRAAKRHMD